MKTAEEIAKELGFYHSHTKAVDEHAVKAMKIYANQKLDEATTEFERLKPAESLRDILYLDGVKSVISSLKDKV